MVELDSKPSIEDVKELVSNKKFTELKELLEDMDRMDIVDILADLDDTEDVLVFKLLSKDKAAEVFSKLNSDVQESIIRGSTDPELADILSSMFIDDMVYVVEEMPANAVNKILKNTSKEDRDIINQILRYPEDSAGSIMTTEYVSLKASMTVGQALDHINRIGQEVISVYVCYAVDAEKKLLGYVLLSDILVANAEDSIGDHLREDIVYIHTLQDQEEALDLFKKYGYSVIPVVDEEIRIVGIISVDDILDVMEEEDTEDFQKRSGIVAHDDSYLDSPPHAIAKHRLPWLVLLMLTSSISGAIIGSYSGLLAAYAVLNSFVPMIMGTGGNAGNQSSTLIIRGMSTGEIEANDGLRVLFKEARVSLILGLVLAVANFFKMLIIERQAQPIVLIVSVSMFFTILVANLLGALLPMLVKRLGMDPANVASPLLTTLVDIVSLLIYFNIASLVLS